MPKTTMNQLDALKQLSIVVADTGDITAIKVYQPEDATTNPSLILNASKLDQYQDLLAGCISEIQNTPKESNIQTKAQHVVELFSVKLGTDISKIIPGRISTEVDARLSFNTTAMIDAGRRLIRLYAQEGVDRSRILIKIAATWEGIEAARVLEAENIQCNLTLIFSFYQAVAAAQANAFLISPFVGRVLDWYKKNHADQDFSGVKDPGVLSVAQIHHHFKVYNYSTIVMGASFRNLEQIENLAGCSRLTISPTLMQSLQEKTQALRPATLMDKPKDILPDVRLSEEAFRWQLNQDPMSTEKLAEGIRNFSADQESLEQDIQARL